jgi:hypothetical protein
MAELKKEELYKLLKKAYHMGVHGHFDLGDQICLEILNDCLNDLKDNSADIETVNIGVADKASWNGSSTWNDNDIRFFNSWSDFVVSTSTVNT